MLRKHLFFIKEEIFVFTPSEIRYILAIYELGNAINAVRSVDIANALCISRASVVKMLKSLSNKGIILKPHYGDVMLTDLGVKKANDIYIRYTLIYNYFIKYLKVDADNARKDSVFCLCSLSEQSIKQIIDASSKMSITLSV